MKKIALASAAMGGAALLAFGASGTFAAFEDQETVASQSVGGGVIDLRVGGPTASADQKPLELAPGDSVGFAYFVRNAGNIDGVLNGDLTATGSENGCVEAETENGGGCVDGTEGQFVAAADYQAFRVPGVARASDCTPEAEDRTEYGDAVALPQAAAAGMVPFFDVAAGESVCFVYEVTLDGNAGNEVQSDTATLSIDLVLEQDTSTRA